MHDTREYFSREAFSSPMFIVVFSFSYGILVAGWHTWMSFGIALAVYIFIVMCTARRGLLWPAIGVVCYALGWVLGLRLFACNRGLKLNTIRGQPWRYNCGITADHKDSASKRGLFGSGFHV